ncbi:EAL domain-containing protein [Halomonas sp. 3H]|uniref:EAL domain-containing protein n=1 Tax=Halomonas sp. 3H TaxID=2952527 RepID=UPI0020B76333|nr:EAL domain-containing protein [Halomonas sp. 3H]
MAVKRIARQPGIVWLIVAAGIGLSLLATHQAYRNAEASAQEQFRFAADQVTLRIEERLSAYALVLRGAAGLFDASEEVDRQEWRTYFDKLRVSDAVAGVQGVGFTVRLSPEALSRHEAEVRAEGFPDYRVHPPGPRDTYTAIVYLEPFEGRNLRAFGYDMFAEPVRRAAMEQARDTGMAALSGRVMLVQETDTDIQPGTLMYVPVYRQGTPIDGMAQRREALIGWAYSPYRMHDLMEGILGDWEQRDGLAVGLRIYDGDRETAEHLLFSNKSSSRPSGATPFQQQRLIEFNGTPWRLVFDHLAPGEAITARAAWMTLAGGLIMTALLGALVLSLSATRSRALRMTEALTQTVHERETELESLLARLQTIADRVPGVVYEYRLFADGRSCFPYASDGMQQVYGVAPEALTEDASPVFSAIHPDDLDAVATSIQYSARTLTPWRHEYRVILQEGAEHWLFGDALPHREPDGSTTWYGVINDITERKQSEIALRRAHMEAERFREALDHVGSFIYMKDRDSRYTFANRATLELFGCTAESLPGSEDARFFSSDIARRLRKIDVRVLNGEPTTEEISVHDGTGRRRVYLEVKTPIREDGTNGNIIGLLGISTDITTLKEHERQLEHLAHYDPLTGLPNRVLLADRLTHAMAQEHRQGRHLAVVYLDLDGFKHINDRYGHAAGDQLLISVAQRMKGVMREGDTLSRLGGDEFVAVLQDLADESVATGLFERLLHVASQPVWHESHALRVTASLGVSFYPQADPVEADQLLRQADQAMYQAKLAGKGRYHLFDAERDRSMRSHHETLERIQQGLQEGEFRLHYQPKVNMRTGETIGVEALVRWQHPTRGLLPPAQFLPVIEEHPLSEALGEWVIRTALAQAAAWRLAGLDLPVSVNVSARQLRQRDLVARLKRLLGDHPDLPPGALELEVLETSTLGDLAQVSNLLEGCRQIGVQVSLDDFGTGYSSLTYLKRLPASIVKIDQSFVRDILDDPEDLKILDGVFSLATAFDRQVIAEGVETVRHGDMLLRVGCELAQGYGIARPMPAEAIPGWLHDWRPPSHWAELPTVDHASRPLLYAGAEHRSWVRQIASGLTSEAPERPPLDASRCGFCQWLVPLHDAMGSEIERLDRLHRQAHRLAADLFALHDAGEGKQVIDRLPELYDRRDALLVEIERLLGCPSAG